MAESKLHSKVGLRVRALCGYCAQMEHAGTTRSSNTQHIILAVDKDEELEMKFYLIECRNCGSRTEYFPRRKDMSRSEIRRLKARLDEQKTARSEAKSRMREEYKASLKQ